MACRLSQYRVGGQRPRPESSEASNHGGRGCGASPADSQAGFTASKKCCSMAQTSDQEVTSVPADARGQACPGASGLGIYTPLAGGCMQARYRKNRGIRNGPSRLEPCKKINRLKTIRKKNVLESTEQTASTPAKQHGQTQERNLDNTASRTWTAGNCPQRLGNSRCLEPACTHCPLGF